MFSRKLSGQVTWKKDVFIHGLHQTFNEYNMDGSNGKFVFSLFHQQAGFQISVITEDKDMVEKLKSLWR